MKIKNGFFVPSLSKEFGSPHVLYWDGSSFTVFTGSFKNANTIYGLRLSTVSVHCCKSVFCTIKSTPPPFFFNEKFVFLFDWKLVLQGTAQFFIFSFKEYQSLLWLGVVMWRCIIILKHKSLWCFFTKKWSVEILLRVTAVN